VPDVAFIPVPDVAFIPVDDVAFIPVDDVAFIPVVVLVPVALDVVAPVEEVVPPVAVQPASTIASITPASRTARRPDVDSLDMRTECRAGRPLLWIAA